MTAPGPEPARRRPTLVDVARASGVSTAAVSYALNGLPGVGEQSRRRVLRVAREMGFRPNRLARGLRHGRNRVLGLLLADIANPFYPELASAVVDAAATAGYEVFLSHAGLHQEGQRAAIAALLDHQCDGFVFTSVIDSDRAALEELRAARVPFVQVIRRIDDLDADFVGIDDRAAGRDIALHALLGRRRPVVLGGPAESSASRDRLRGYTDALAEHRLALLREDLTAGELTRESGYARATALLSDPGADPDVLICGNDMIALGAIDALVAAGRRVGSGVAVVGFDDMSFASSALIGLTTVRVPRFEIGRVAVRVLLQRSEDMEALAQKVILPHRVVVRATCPGASAAGV